MQGGGIGVAWRKTIGDREEAHASLGKVTPDVPIVGAGAALPRAAVDGDNAGRILRICWQIEIAGQGSAAAPHIFNAFDDFVRSGGMVMH